MLATAAPGLGQLPPDSAALADSASRLREQADSAYQQGTRESLERSLRLWLRSSALYRRLGDRWLEGTVLQNAGNVHADLGRPDSALAYYRWALALSEGDANGDRRANALMAIGTSHSELGRADSALIYLRRALDLQRELGDRRGEASTLGNLAIVQFGLGRLDSALVFLHRALPILRQIGDRRREGNTLSNIGAVHGALGRPDSALANYRQSLALQRELGDRRGEGQTLGNIGILQGALGHPDSAVIYHSQSLAAKREVGDRRGEGNALTNIGAVHHGLGRPDSALHYFHEALAIHREIRHRYGEAATLSNIGETYRSLGQPDSALVYYQLALALNRQLGDRATEGTTLTNLGVLHSNLGHPDSALVYYRRALPIHRQVGNREVEGKTLRLIGVEHRILGRPDSAFTYLRRALRIDRDIRNPQGEAESLGNIGNVYYDLGRPDSALSYYRRVLAIMQEIDDRRGEGGTLANIGVLHDELGQTDSSLVYYRRALALARDVGDPMGEENALFNIGGVQLVLGDADSALAYFRRALAVSLEVGDRGEGRTLTNIGSAQLHLGHPDSALTSYRKALAVHREVGDRDAESATLQLLGTLHYLHLPSRQPGVAVAYYDSAAAVRASIAAHSGSDPNRLSYAEQYVGLHQDWALAWLARSDEVGRERSARSALAVAERGRAQALLDLMLTSAGGAAALLSPVQSLTTPGGDLAEEGERLAEAVTRGGAAGLTYLMTDDTLLAWLIEPSGEVSVARRPVARDSVAMLVRALRAGLGVDDATAGAQLALRGALELEAPTGTEAGAPLRRGLRYAETAAEALARLLLPTELADRLPDSGELVIVPEGPLALVPFSALPLGDAGGLAEFGNRFAVRYAPSLATLDLAERRPGIGEGPERAEALSRAVIVGNPRMPQVVASSGERSGLAPLPQAEDEAAWLAERLGVSPLTGAEATEDAIREALPTSRLVHLATHGYAYSTEAWARRSFVALAPDEQHDGLLTVGEILDDPELELEAELVVLSACQTGLGDLKEAEGTVGLQRALLARGARSVLVSLWSVSDVVTEELMKRFYTHWLEDEDSPSKAEALRRAKLDIRSTPGWEHPRFWAAFQLVGAG